MEIKILSRRGKTHSFNISHWAPIPVGTFNPGVDFYVKNITNSDITENAVGADMETSQSTVLYPGWNVELFKEINCTTVSTLLYGM